LASGATFPVGTTTNTFTVTDAAGLTTSCSFTVTVVDNQAPAIACPANITTAKTSDDGAGNCTTTVALGNPLVSDNCTPTGSLLVTNNAPSAFPIGTTNVTWTVKDAANNTSTCTQNVTVIDDEAPSINCPANVQVAANAGCTATGVALVTPVANDNCSVASVTNNAPVAFPLGSTTVTWTATDASGNTATCTQTVTVLDQTLPTAICKNISVNLNALGTASITAADINNNSTDNCGIASLVASKTSFDCTNLGTNSVTLTVTDTSGNVSSCIATVTIVDAIVPVALCKPFTLSLNASGNATLFATDIDNGSSDNCSFTRTISKSSFNCSNLGANTVVLTITDASGNFTTCNAIVTVVDAIAPVAQCKNFTLNLDATGNATLLATDIDNGSTDNCSIVTRTVSPSSFTCANVGNNTVTLTVTDTSGNIATCTATVTIKDLIDPTAICKNISVNLDNTGSAVITPAMVDNGSSDNCGLVTLSLNKTSFNCINLGPNAVILTVTDTAGNSSACNATVTVVDNIAPVATCKNYTLVLAANGTGTLLPANINNGSTDNCGIATMTLSKTNFTCTDANGTPQSVTLTVTDASGNSNSCIATVTVQSSLTITQMYLDVCGYRFNSTVTGGQGPYTYSWDATAAGNLGRRPFTACLIFCPSTNTSALTSPFYNLSLANGTYTAILTVTDANGCKATKTLTFDGGLLPGSTTDVNSSACINDTKTYSSPTTGNSYSWSVVGGTALTPLTNSSVNIKWDQGTGLKTVQLVVTSFFGICNSTVVNHVTVNPLPVPAFVTPITTPVCPQSPQTYTLVANTFSTRAWTVTGGTVTAGGDPADNSVTVKWDNGATGTVSVTVTNPVASGGCSSTVSTNVAIVDIIPPTITCPADVTVNANTGLCYATGVNLGTTPTGNDNCGVASVTNNALTLFPTGQYPIGVHTITWTVTDYKGLTANCTQTVTVTDNQFPVISCPTNVSQSILTGCNRSITINNPTTSDNCGVSKLTWTMTGATVANSLATGINNVGTYTFNRGVTTITYNAFDNSGKSSSCSFTVTITDTIPPTITCPGPINTTTNTACTATAVALGTPTTADNCSVVSVTNNAPAAYPIGLTTVTWTVTDVAGLTATCTQTVTVTDTTPPTIACPTNITTTTAVGVCTRIVNVPSPTTADNCSVASLSWMMSGATTATGINPIGNYTFNLGVTTITFTVTDSANNFENCSFTVTVNDNQPPIFTSCPTNPAPLCADNSATYTKIGTSWNAIATDGCSTISSLTYTLSGSTTGSGTNLNGVAFNVGTTTVTWTATDTAGNVSNCVFTVTIIGLPVITIQPLSQLDCEGASVNFTVVATGSGLTYSWQYKRPVDSSYTTIISNSTTVDNFDEYKITIRNVGGTQFPNGTQFQVIVSNSSGCSVTSNAATLSVNEIVSLTGATTTTQCYGTNSSYEVITSYPANVLSYQWKSSVVSGVWNDVVNGTHFSGAQSAKLDILSGTPAESAAYRVYITFDALGADCNVNSSSRSRSITFLPELTPPVAAITQPDCITPTGSVTLSGLPASGTWTLTRSGTSSATTTGSGTSTIITGLAPGTYTYTVTLGTCTSVASADVVIQAATTAIWNGTAWTNGPPTSNQALIFTGSYDSSVDLPGDLTACSCTVTSGAVVFNPSHALKITNWVHVNGGSLTFENTSSLVQTNNVTNIGNITYKRNFTGGEFDYTYWSSPVAGQNLLAFSPSTKLDKFFSFNSVANDWVQENPATATMTIGKGYIIRGIPIPSGPPPPGFGTNSFIGIPNNGHFEITGIIADRSYLLGNPYPSALDADSFLVANAAVLNGTLYFWTHNTPIAIGTPNPGTGVWAYSGNDYAAYNATGGVGAAPPDIDPLTGLPYPGQALSGGTIPTGKIAAGQGFFGSTKVSVSGPSIVYNNNMRVGVIDITTEDNTQFFKTKNPKSKTTSVLEKHRIWLDLTNSQGAFKQTLVGYITDATNGYEGRFDGESYDGNDFLDFYSILQDKNLTIQGRALPFDENDEIPLGYRVAIGGTFSIVIDQIDGLLSNQAVFIEDKLTNTVYNLKNGKYTFTTAAGTFDDRFVLRYTDKTLGADELEANDGIVALYSTNYKTLIIRNNVKDATVNSVTLFSLSGQKIAYWDVKGREQSSIQIPIKNLPAEIYIVKIKTTQGDFSKKIIIK
jgi:large repetitive protein